MIERSRCAADPALRGTSEWRCFAREVLCKGMRKATAIRFMRALELAVVPTNHVHVGSKLTPKSCRHPDGVETGDSVCAIPDGDAAHVCLLLEGVSRH